MKTSQAGVDLIKEFEGFRSDAYLCPAGVWTIGYGHTAGVKPGDYVSRERGEEMLREDLKYYEDAVNDLITVPLVQNEFDALVSFTYNLGVGALGESTLRKRLNAGEPKCPVFQQELPKWVKAGGQALVGLVRRREAEADLACAGPVEEEQPEISFLETAAFYYASEPHQKQAWRDLERELDPVVLEQFKKAYRAVQEPQVIESRPVTAKFPLDVPYFYQRDSKTGHGERMCFSSSMAMALDYLDPDAIEGDDDWYLNIVFKYGDSVSSEAQIAAARSLGFDEAEFRMDGSRENLEELLDFGVPVPIGILHHGSVDRPTGGGHWICLIGYDETEFIVHDPFGRMDLDNGGYIATGPVDGKFIRYTKEKLLKRWLIASDHDGWFVRVA